MGVRNRYLYPDSPRQFLAGLRSRQRANRPDCLTSQLALHVHLRPSVSSPTGPTRGAHMGFSGMRAVIMVFVLVVLVVAVSQLDLPGWIVPVGLIAVGVLMKAWQTRASS